jgi:LmbE family N-acetylglucosaminyl deacetylase
MQKHFNPADAGTPEYAWRAMLRHSGDWSPNPGRLIVVAPHPDDEVLGAGGLVSSWALSGQPVSIVSVTDGEAADLSRKELSRVRRSELRNALRKLALLHVEIVSLGIPDGKVASQKNRLRAVLLERVEQGCTLIAPYEDDGHPDHEAVGHVCLEVAQLRKVAIARYPIWAWHHATPFSFRTGRWGLFRLAAVAQRAKLRAVQCFDSQLRPPHGAPIVPGHVLTHFERPYEAFLI